MLRARRSVRHGGDEADLGAKLGLQSIVLEGQGGSCGDRFEVLGLGVQPSVVDDRSDADAVTLDQLHCPAVVGRRLLDALAL